MIGLKYPTAGFVCLGRVNGMSEPDENGSYVLISVRQKEGGRPYRAQLSLGGAKNLVAEIQGCLGVFTSRLRFRFVIKSVQV